MDEEQGSTNPRMAGDLGGMTPMRELRPVTNNSVRSGWLKIGAENNKRFKWIKAVLAERGLQLGQLAEGQIVSDEHFGRN